MKLKRLGPSATVLELADGTRVLFSYETPVAAEITADAGSSICRHDSESAFPAFECICDGGWLKSSAFHSRTTSRHIGQFIPAGVKARAVDPSVISALVEGV